MPRSQPQELVVRQDVQIALAEVKRAIEDTTDPGALKSLRDKAEAIRTYVKNAALGLQLQNQAAEVKLRAERRAGHLLSQLKLRGGNRRAGNGLRLRDLGITQNQSTRWQMENLVPEVVFEQYVQSVSEQAKELTSSGLLHLARQHSSSKGRPHNVKRTNHHCSQRVVCDLVECVRLASHRCALLVGMLQPSIDGLGLSQGEVERVRRLSQDVSDCLAEAADLAAQLR